MWGRGCCTTTPYKGSTIPPATGRGGCSSNLQGDTKYQQHWRVTPCTAMNVIHDIVLLVWSLPSQSNESLSSQPTGFLTCCWLSLIGIHVIMNNWLGKYIYSIRWRVTDPGISSSTSVAASLFGSSYQTLFSKTYSETSHYWIKSSSILWQQ